MTTRQERFNQCLKEIEQLFEDEQVAYRLGYLQGWLARLATDDVTVRQDLEARLERKINDRIQKGNAHGQRGPRARS